MLLLVLAGAAVAADGSPPGGTPPPGPSETVTASVVEVTDGDTIVAAFPGGRTESVRYIGVDTPESTPNQPLECFGHEAAAANAALVGGHQLRLSFGPERRDDYGRLLAYVRVERSFVNATLVRRGYARTLTIAPNDQHAELFSRLEAAAGRAGRGLWGACGG